MRSPDSLHGKACQEIGSLFYMDELSLGLIVSIRAFVLRKFSERTCGNILIVHGSTILKLRRLSELIPPKKGIPVAQSKLHGCRWLGVESNKNPISIQNGLSRYGDVHYKGKTVVKASYLYNWCPCSCKTVPLYWDKRISLYKRYCILVQISPKFVSWGAADGKWWQAITRCDGEHFIHVDILHRALL